MMAEKKAALNKKAEAAAVDMDQFKGMKTYSRPEVEEDGLFKLQKESAAAKEAREAKEKKTPTVLETNFKIASEEAARGAGRGGRGGRGPRPEGGRGGRGAARGGNGGRAPRAAGADVSIAIEDQSAFPSLA
jgi:hypothetical protein